MEEECSVNNQVPELERIMEATNNPGNLVFENDEMPFGGMMNYLIFWRPETLKDG